MESLYNNLRYWSAAPSTLAHLDAVDAQMDREDSLSDRYAFLLGEDMGVVRFELDRDSLDDEMLRGYQRGLTFPARAADVYLRKLLTLRRNAYARRIPVSSVLTRDYLKSVAVTVCPVSGADLTQGTQTDSDWSVDRLDNTLGYVPGNLCVMSTRVNQLKDRLEHWELVNDVNEKLLKDGPQALNMVMDNGLHVIECLRLASLTAAPHAISRSQVARYMPFAQAPFAWCSIDTAVASIHLACARTLVPGRAYAKRVQFFKRLGSSYWQMSNRFVTQLRGELAKGVHPADMWLDGAHAMRLRELTDTLLATPMTLSGISSDEALAQIKVTVGFVGQFAR
ncbi:hypothetical protein ISG32_26225 [Diaphorobacter sp. NR2-3-3-1]|nr:hypothetical protein [Diaphorobacter caeni]